MSERTGIEWCDSTFNPWIGCTRVSPACDHCYAAVSTPARTLGIEWGAGQQRRRTSESNWKLPLRWNTKPFVECTRCGLRSESPAAVAGVEVPGLGPVYCGSCGEENRGSLRDARRRVFCASLADVFDNEIDPEWRRDLFRLIAATQNLDWLLLTKRIGNASAMLAEVAQSFGMVWDGWRNVWLGATICNQQEADRDIPKLLATPAAVRFLSIEPMLGPVDLTDLQRQMGAGTVHHVDCLQCDVDPADDEWGGANIDWVIAGGESGAHARPMHPAWVRSLRDQCVAAGVPFLFKQWGEWRPAPGMIGEPGQTLFSVGGTQHLILGDGYSVARVGKKAAGRTLDGQVHNGFPATA